MGSPGRPLVVCTLLLLSLIWGTTWAAIRIGLDGVPPFTGVSLRFAIAAAVLLLVGRLSGVRYGRSRREWILWIVNGVLSFSVSYGIVYWCEQRVPSGLAAVLFATFPLFVAVLARFLLPEEASRPALAGTLLGFGGVALIYSEDLSKIGGPGIAVSCAVMLAAPFVSAVASVAIKRWGRGIHPLSITAVPMALGAALTGAVAAVTERGRPVLWSGWSIGALLYLALAGSAVTFSLYYWLLAHIPATQVALIAYLSPIIAVTIGAVFLHEPYTPKTLAGSALVVGGVVLAARPFRRWTVRAALAVVVLGGSLPLLRAQEASGLRFPADPAPPVVRALGPLDGVLAFTLADDASSAAAASGVPAKGSKGRMKSTLLVASGEAAPRRIEIEGQVRALRFASDGSLYVIVTEEPTRLGGGESSLLRFDPGSSKPARDVRLPLTARGMDLTVEGDALVIASLSELRVVLVPDLRSSRLFRIPGENLAVACLAGSSRILVGRKAEILLVDLSDPQSHDGMPVRARVEAPGEVVSLAASPGGDAALARLDDGRTLQVTVEPLAVREDSVSAAIAWPGARLREPAVAPVVPPPPVEAPAAPPSAPEAPAPSPEPEAPAETSPAVPPPEQAKVEPPPVPVDAVLGIRGRVRGPAASEAKAVVILGPDNVLREAARVTPANDGTWETGPLPTGRYRIVVDVGPGRIAVTDPPFATVTLGAVAVAAPDLELRSVQDR